MSDAPEDALLRDLGRRAAEREQPGANPPLSDTEAARLDAASRPLDGAAKARIVAHLRREVPRPSQPASAPAPIETASGPIPFPSRRIQRLVLPLAAVLAIAVSALVFRAMQRPDDGSAALASMPRYALRIDGASQEQRAPGDHSPADNNPSTSRPAPVRTAVGNQLRVQLTPHQPATTTVTARAYRQSTGADWQPVTPALVSVSGHGAVLLDAVLGTELALAAGDQHALLLVLGDASSLPDAPAAARASQATGRATGTGWQAFLITLEVSAPP